MNRTRFVVSLCDGCFPFVMDVLTDKTRVKGGEIISSTEGFGLLLSPLSFVFFIIIIDKSRAMGKIKLWSSVGSSSKSRLIRTAAVLVRV